MKDGANHVTMRDMNERNNKDQFDLLIISHCQYETSLTKLVIHKNNVGIKTKLVTTCDIYSESYTPLEGRDDQEIIKYFIKYAIEEWNISFVLLVGDFRQIPVRYSYIETKYDTMF